MRLNTKYRTPMPPGALMNKWKVLIVIVVMPILYFIWRGTDKYRNEGIHRLEFTTQNGSFVTTSDSIVRLWIRSAERGKRSAAESHDKQSHIGTLRVGYKNGQVFQTRFYTTNGNKNLLFGEYTVVGDYMYTSIELNDSLSTFLQFSAGKCEAGADEGVDGNPGH